MNLASTQSQHNESFTGNFLDNSDQRKAYSATAVKAFINMMEHWQLSIAQRCAILGDIPKPTYYKWAKGNVGTLSRDQLERIGVTLGIYKALKLLFVDENGRMNWFKSPNQDYAFQGLSPLERMCLGGMLDLYAVRQYVDALRGGS